MSATEAGCSCGGLLTVLDSAHVALRIDSSVYSVEAMLRAAYKLTDRAFILFDRCQGGFAAFIVGRSSSEDVRELVGVFANELIDQQVRVRLEERFAPVRTLIAAQAFAEGNLLDPERHHADYNADPLGIGKSR